MKGKLELWSFKKKKTFRAISVNLNSYEQIVLIIRFVVKQRQRGMKLFQFMIHTKLICDPSVCFQWKPVGMHPRFLSLYLIFYAFIVKLICSTGAAGTVIFFCLAQEHLCCNIHPTLSCRRRCQSRPPQWHQGPAASLGGEDGGAGPVEQQDRVHPVGGRLHHRPGQHVALPLPLLQERRRWVEDELSGWRKGLKKHNFYIQPFAIVFTYAQ